MLGRFGFEAWRAASSGFMKRGRLGASRAAPLVRNSAKAGAALTAASLVWSSTAMSDSDGPREPTAEELEWERGMEVGRKYGENLATGFYESCLFKGALSTLAGSALSKRFWQQS